MIAEMEGSDPIVLFWIHGAEVLADRISDSGIEVAGLPPRFADRYDDDFTDRFLEAIDAVISKLKSKEDERPTSTAEELALHCILRESEGLLDELADQVRDDDDIFLLWEEPEPDPIVHKLLRKVNLEFDKWFVPFGSAEEGGQ